MSRAPAAFFARLIRRRLVAEPWPCLQPAAQRRLQPLRRRRHGLHRLQFRRERRAVRRLPHPTVRLRLPDVRGEAGARLQVLRAGEQRLHRSTDCGSAGHVQACAVHAVGACRVSEPGAGGLAGRGVYYLLFDRLSCFGPQGSGAVVYTSTSPMGATRRPPASPTPIAEGECCLQGRTRRRTTSTATGRSVSRSWASSSSRRSRHTSFSSERLSSVRPQPPPLPLRSVWPELIQEWWQGWGTCGTRTRTRKGGTSRPGTTRCAHSRPRILSQCQ